MQISYVDSLCGYENGYMGHGHVHGRELHETSLKQTETISVSRSCKELGVSFQPLVFCESHVAFLMCPPCTFMV